MKTLVLYDSTDPVQVAGAVVIKHALNPGVTLRNAETALAGYDQVFNLRPINTEQQYAIAVLALGFAPGSDKWESCDEFGVSSIGKSNLKWTPNEHAGKWIVIHNGDKYDLAKIHANDADTITVTGLFTNTPDADTTFKIVDSLPIFWADTNPVLTYWNLLTSQDMSYPMWLLADQHILVQGETTMSDSTHFLLNGYGSDRLKGAYIACKVPSGKIYSRKIIGSTATHIEIDSAIEITETPTIYVYTNENQILHEFMFGLFISEYMSDPHDYRWIRLFDETGALKQGGGTTNDEELFDVIMKEAYSLLLSYLEDNSQTIADVPYLG